MCPNFTPSWCWKRKTNGRHRQHDRASKLQDKNIPKEDEWSTTAYFQKESIQFFITNLGPSFFGQGFSAVVEQTKMSKLLQNHLKKSAHITTLNYAPISTYHFKPVKILVFMVFAKFSLDLLFSIQIIIIPLQHPKCTLFNISIIHNTHLILCAHPLNS